MPDAIDGRSWASRWGPLPLVVFALVATAARAQNLLPFPSFDSSADFTNGWSNISQNTFWFGGLDLEGNPSSGSLEIVNRETSAGIGIGVFSACVTVVPGDLYWFSVWQLTPSPQPASGNTLLGIEWRQSCPAGPFTGSDLYVSSTAEGAWTHSSGVDQAPLTAHGARLAMDVVKQPAGDTRTTYFDEAYLPEPATDAGALVVTATLIAIARRRRV